MTDQVSWTRIEITPSADQWTIYAETTNETGRTTEFPLGWVRPLGNHGQAGRIEGYRAVSNGYGYTTDRAESPIGAAIALTEWINRIGYWQFQAQEKERELKSLANDARSMANDIESELQDTGEAEDPDYWIIDSNIEELEDLARQMKEKANEAQTYRHKGNH